MSILGTRVVRTEDPRLLTAGGVYTDDLRIPELDGAARITFVRSPVAHAGSPASTPDAALAVPGVVAVLAAAGHGRPAAAAGAAMADPTEPCWPPDRVRYVGEAVAIVVTEHGYQGEDAAELVSVDYEPLPAVVGFDDALAGRDAAVRRHRLQRDRVRRRRRARRVVRRLRGRGRSGRSRTSGWRRCRWRAARPPPAGRTAG